jgi:hypothetical protein
MKETGEIVWSYGRLEYVKNYNLHLPCLRVWVLELIWPSKLT